MRIFGRKKSKLLSKIVILDKKRNYGQNYSFGHKVKFYYTMKPFFNWNT